MFRKTFEDGPPELHIVFDGGYNGGLGVGTWAVVLVYKDKEVLLEYGHAYKTTSSDLEFRGAQKALQYAFKLGVETIIGDCEGCMKSMNKKYPEFTWGWTPSKSNVADKYTKHYPSGV